MTRARFVALFCLLLLVPARATAQAERFEIGQRLRTFEAAWEQQKDPAARKRALAAIQDLVTQFFRGRFDEAARSLAAGQDALRSQKQPAADVRWAQSLALGLARRLADTDLAELPVTLAPFFKTQAAAPQGVALKLTLLASDGKTVLAAREAPIAALPLAIALPLKEARPAEG